ncbi:helix-turn-helix domain-containing protein [Paraflavitalea pollutisoli]|uniref:helix-turn-helix domain-containing protein n=1 Tax=Paraflavitalea pollutisoli TaxID=3034143 RepID=UPI0023EB57FC|nr:helix-turn-helix domain-containing protein [Paraflavitalea sp. H1-2-19X]
MNQQHRFQSSLKTLGLLSVNKESEAAINQGDYKAYIKVLYLHKGYKITVDFAAYATEQPTLFFIGPNQYLQLETLGKQPGQLIYYNRDFYCIQIHDEEVACDGLLFNNIHNMPMTVLTQDEAALIDPIFAQMLDEFELNDASQEEMIRTYLKQLFIRSTRIWKKQHLDKTLVQQPTDLEFFRKFTQLVDAHYKARHSVADYADLLAMAAKTITHKFKRLNLPQPNEVIKNRIILEAKRLLVHTSLTAKEIAYELGYEDPAYFSRQFLLKTGESPSGYRAKFLLPTT